MQSARFACIFVNIWRRIQESNESREFRVSERRDICYNRCSISVCIRKHICMYIINFYLLSNDAIIKYVNSYQNVMLYDDLFFVIFRAHLHIFVGQVSPSFSQYCLFSVIFNSCRIVFVLMWLHGSCRAISFCAICMRLFPGTTISIIFLDTLSSSLLLMCTYQFNVFFPYNVCILYDLFLTRSFLVILLIHSSILVSTSCTLF